MLVSERNKLLYLHNPKTAGTSVSNWLTRSLHAQRLAPTHATAMEARVFERRWDGYFKFGFVRNPWDRLASWWRMIRENPEREKDNPLWIYVRANSRTFEEFVLRCVEEIPAVNGRSFHSFARPQLDHFTDSSGNMLVDFIGRYENLEHDWGVVLSQIPPGALAPQASAPAESEPWAPEPLYRGSPGGGG